MMIKLCEIAGLTPTEMIDIIACISVIILFVFKDEIISLYEGVLHYLSLIFLYVKERFSERSENRKE